MLTQVLRVALAALLLVVLPISGTQANEDTIKLRAIFWNVGAFSRDFRADFSQKAAGIATYESHESYTFTNGAISRGLGAELRSGWQRGEAKTVSVRVSGLYAHPGASGSFSSSPGDYHDFPDDTYFEQTVSRDLLRRHGDPQFRVEISIPPDCRLPEFLGGREQFLILSTRTWVDGENELLIVLDMRPPTPAFNMHFLLDCS